MLKATISMKDSADRALAALKLILQLVPALEVEDIQQARSGPDIVVTLNVRGHRHRLLCEVKESGQPRFVQMALLQLNQSVAHLGPGTTPVLLAPYLSPEAQALCRQNRVGFVDFEGNARLAFDHVFIERAVESKPAAEKRRLRSLFKPKSAQVLEVLLREPTRMWRVQELAKATGVSLGHISNVRAALADREWGRVSPEGFTLVEPDKLLDAWCDAYEGAAGERRGFYTTLHDRTFDEAVRRLLGVANDTAQVIFGSFSAAHWLAPYARTGTHFFYTDERGAECLRNALELASPAEGENVVITVPSQDVVFRSAIAAPSGVVCTGLVQTYLDLSAAGERGREAAEHLRRERLRWRE
jgi:hypothetical protein